MHFLLNSTDQNLASLWWSAKTYIIRHDAACHEHAAAGIRDMKMLQRSLEELRRTYYRTSSQISRMLHIENLALDLR